MISGAVVKLDGWTNQSKPTCSREDEAMYALIEEAVETLCRWQVAESEKRGWPYTLPKVQLQEIYDYVCSKVHVLKRLGQWAFPLRDKRTWDRRVNETASLQRGVPRIVAVSGGYYTVNHSHADVIGVERKNE